MYRHNQKKPDEILKLDTFKRNANQLRRCLIEIGRQYKCEKCDITEWYGQPIVIEIHHKDGNPLNNVESNLQFLCPNCHSLTPNFYNTKKQLFCKCGNTRTKNAQNCAKCSQIGKIRLSTRKVERPNKKELEKLVWEKPTILISKDFGVSDKAIEKWCKSYGIDKPPRGYWSKQK